MSNVSIDKFVRELAGDQCEALLNLEPQVWTRCGKSPTEVHHRLPRSRGGLLLDFVYEHYHLLALCREHHKFAHEDTKAFETGLMLEGRVLSKNNTVMYTGPDPYLGKKYGGERWATSTTSQTS